MDIDDNLSTKVLLASVQRRALMNNSRDFGLPESLNRARKVPTPTFRRRLNISGDGIRRRRLFRYRNSHGPRPHHHRPPHSIGVVFVVIFSFLASLTLLKPKHGPKCRRFTCGRRQAPIADLGVLIAADEPRPRTEKRDRHRPRAPEGRLALNEARQSPERSGAVARGGRRRRRRRAASARPDVGAVGAEASEAFAEADRADSALPALRWMLNTFPDVFFVSVERHFPKRIFPYSFLSHSLSSAR